MKSPALSSLLLIAAAVAQQEPRPPLGAKPAQPLPFSHRAHSGVGLKCAECHPAAATAKAAGMPSVDFCMRCHIAVKKESPSIAALARRQKDRQPVDWIRVYRLPDYVYFSHRRHHAQARIACDACHGEVAAQDVLSKAKSIGMPACQACHDIRKANNNCDACHDPHPG
jgi:hypothetical protein